MKETRLFICGSVAAAALAFAACSKVEQVPTVIPTIPVHMAQATQKDLPVEIKAVGTVEGYRSVSVVPQVTGQILDIHFKEGQDVKKGDLLFSIDPSTYREELRKAEASLAKEIAQLENYKAEADRYAFLMEKGAVSKSDYEKVKTSADTQRAFVNTNMATVQDARLKLDYCSLRAPIDGRVGGFQVNKGAVVTGNSTTVLTINQIAPVYVRFSVPEKNFPDVRSYAARSALKVLADLPGYVDSKRDGKLEFIDNTIDPETGAIKLKALFPNTDRFLWPGQFVNVTLWLTMQKGCTVVPAPAVQLAQDSKYVFIVKDDKTVKRQPVVVGRTFGEEVVIARGVNPGDTVVTDGHFKLKDGFKVVAVPDDVSKLQDSFNIVTKDRKKP